MAGHSFGGTVALAFPLWAWVLIGVTVGVMVGLPLVLGITGPLVSALIPGWREWTKALRSLAGDDLVDAASRDNIASYRVVRLYRMWRRDRKQTGISAEEWLLTAPDRVEFPER